MGLSQRFVINSLTPYPPSPPSFPLSLKHAQQLGGLSQERL